MEPITTGVVAAGAAMGLIYLVRQRQSRPTRTARRGSNRAPGGEAKRSWLVKMYNSTGAPEVTSSDLSGASAELTGRAAGAVGRAGKRRWRIVAQAAERSHDRRRKRWQDSDSPTVLGFRRKPPPASTPVPPEPPVPTRAAQPKAAPPVKPRHLQAVPTPHTRGDAMDTATTNGAAPTTVAPEHVPPDWNLLADRIANFTPEDDAALIAFMRGEVAGVIRYAEAMEQARENCVNDVGLDPSAVAGFTAYSEHMSEASARMSEAWVMVMAVYGQVMQLAADGVTMPHRGRFFTGNTA